MKALSSENSYLAAIKQGITPGQPWQNYTK